MGGGSVTIDWDRGKGVLTSITAYRYWDWNPSNDRDFLGLPITTVSAAPSHQTQFTQEVRYAAKINDRLNYLVGVFLFNQGLKPSPFHKQEQGSAAARFLLAPSTLASTPGLLDGYGQNIDFDFRNTSSAGFGQIEYALTNKLKIIPGLRLNYDQKKLDYNQVVYGGLQTTDGRAGECVWDVFDRVQVGWVESGRRSDGCGGQPDCVGGDGASGTGTALGVGVEVAAVCKYDSESGGVQHRDP
jgi:iron complex outermembrane receptor protein